MFYTNNIGFFVHYEYYSAVCSMNGTCDDIMSHNVIAQQHHETLAPYPVNNCFVVYCNTAIVTIANIFCYLSRNVSLKNKTQVSIWYHHQSCAALLHVALFFVSFYKAIIAVDMLCGVFVVYVCAFMLRAFNFDIQNQYRNFRFEYK